MSVFLPDGRVDARRFARAFDQQYGRDAPASEALVSLFMAQFHTRHKHWESAARTIRRGRKKLAQEVASAADFHATLNKAPSYTTPSEDRQSAVIARSRAAFQNWQAQQEQFVKLTFVSDVHLPYQDDRAINLLCQIIADYKPDVRVALSDVFDFQEYSKNWADARSPASRLWASDIQNAVDLHGNFIRMLDSAHPAVNVGVMGNHDRRLIHFLKQDAGSAADITIAWWMEELEKQGVWQFTRDATQENIVQMSPGLKLVHGVSASADASTVAKKTIQKCGGNLGSGDAGVFYHVAFGHDHRFIIREYNGVMAMGAPCLCYLNPHYAKHPPNWHQGVLLIRYDPNGRMVAPDYIQFYEQGKKRIAFWGDRQYTSD